MSVHSTKLYLLQDIFSTSHASQNSNLSFVYFTRKIYSTARLYIFLLLTIPLVTIENKKVKIIQIYRLTFKFSDGFSWIFLQRYSLEALKLGFFIPWIRIRDPPNFDGSGSLAEKLADPGGSGSETLPSRAVLEPRTVFRIIRLVTKKARSGYAVFKKYCFL